MIDKVSGSVYDAIADVHNGASIMIGGFGYAGTPYNLVKGLIASEVIGLTIICNSFNNIMMMENKAQIAKVVMSFPTAPARASFRSCLEEATRSGEIEVEHVPQGTLIERIRAGGAGIGGFLHPYRDRNHSGARQGKKGVRRQGISPRAGLESGFCIYQSI